VAQCTSSCVYNEHDDKPVAVDTHAFASIRSQSLSGFTLLLLVGLSMVSAAVCNGDNEEPSLSEYFEEIQQISDRADERFVPLQSQIEKDFTSESEELAAWREFFAADLAIVRDYLTDLTNLRPPDEVRAEHRKFVDAADVLFEAILQTNESLASVNSKDHLNQLLNSPELDSPTEAFDAACRDLERVADAQAIALDLDCG
jgi:hypothetical protein